MTDKKSQEQAKNSFAQAEEKVLEFWEKADIFQKSMDREAPNGDYVFYDGPPFATGLPHYGHLVANLMKDTVPRYWTMKGYRVERKWGWDCHGLPLENLAEKELGLKDKKDIEEYGVEKFNQYCESIVLRYADEWKKIIRRVGRWVDMENDYKTMDPEYMESIWWVFKRLWEKDLIYKGYKPMHICPRCGTTLSNFEVSQGYKEISDLSVTAKFELSDEPGTFLLAWTTTPWTLIGNVALAVGEEIDYVKVESLNKDLRHNTGEIQYEKYIISKEYYYKIKEIEGHPLAQQFAHKEKDGEEAIKGPEKISEFKGKDLLDKKYTPLFNYFADKKELENRENGWKIYAGDFVSTEEGTGIVHIAPAFGEDDLQMGMKHDLPFIQHVDMGGLIKEEASDFAGLNVKPREENDKDAHMKTDIEIIKYLAKHNRLFHKEKYKHSYPHCWRCDTPLLNYAAESWFVEVTKFKKELIDNNQKVNWVPAHVKDGRFGKWLEQARDWSISRNRYWGAPLPVWECDSCGEKEVIGSRAELKERAGVDVQDLHKHHVDKLIWQCQKCKGTMRRIPEVLDCWFESGSMPYGQEHYPFENKDRFERNFPAEFVAEGMDQTRGWFYTLMVLATALFGQPAFKNVIANGIVLAEDGRKMSKRLNNYPDPMDVAKDYSVDALRHYLLSSPVLTGENLNFSEDGVKDVFRKTSMLVWNVYKFYAMYADGEKVADGKPQSENVLDKWIIARLDELIGEVTRNMDNYVLPKAVRPIEGFISDLSTWHLRRSRDRFKSEDAVDKRAALNVTGYALGELAKVMAPFTPFIAEELWQRVSGYDFADQEKSVHLEAWPEPAGGPDQEVLDNMDRIRRVVEMGLAKRDEAGIKVRQPLGTLTVRGDKLALEDGYWQLVKDEVNVKEVKTAEGNGALEVELDTQMTDELRQEGIKRELVRFINALRKNAGLTINDRIKVYWQSGSDEIRTAINQYKQDILTDTLADDMEEGDAGGEAQAQKEVKVNSYAVTLQVRKTG